MTEKSIRLSAQEIQRLEAILLDKDKEDALRFLREVVKEKLAGTPGHPCGPKPV